MERIICLAIGYVCGLLQSGYLVGKLHHIDIRKSGSGNAGSTNALRVMGWKAGLMTFAGDVTTNRGGSYLLGDIEFDGSASGNIMGVTTKRGTNTATLSGFMIDAKGVSFTAPDVSSSLTY